METVVYLVPIDASRLIPKWPDLQIALGYRDTAIPEQIQHLLDELLPDVPPCSLQQEPSPSRPQKRHRSQRAK